MFEKFNFAKKKLSENNFVFFLQLYTGTPRFNFKQFLAKLITTNLIFDPWHRN